MPDQTFTSGQILTASQMSTLQTNSGLTFIKSQAVGTAVGDATVADAFSSAFDNYKITYTGGVGSGVQLIGLYLGATFSGYSSTRIINTPSAGTPTGNGDSGGQWAYAGQASTNFAHLSVDIFNPFLARYTYYSGNYFLEQGSTSELGISQGFLNNTTSYTAFTINPASTVTGGTITVYGYRK